MYKYIKAVMRIGLVMICNQSQGVSGDVFGGIWSTGFDLFYVFTYDQMLRFCESLRLGYYRVQNYKIVILIILICKWRENGFFFPF